MVLSHGITSLLADFSLRPPFSSCSAMREPWPSLRPRDLALRGINSWGWTLWRRFETGIPLGVGRATRDSPFAKRVLGSGLMRPLWKSPPGSRKAQGPPSLSLAPETSSSLLFRGQSLLQELLDLIDVRLHVSVEGQEGRMGARGEVVQVGWLSVERARFRGGLHQGASRTGKPRVYCPLDARRQKQTRCEA